MKRACTVSIFFSDNPQFTSMFLIVALVSGHAQALTDTLPCPLQDSLPRRMNKYGSFMVFTNNCRCTKRTCSCSTSSDVWKKKLSSRWFPTFLKRPYPSQVSPHAPVPSGRVAPADERLAVSGWTVLAASAPKPSWPVNTSEARHQSIGPGPDVFEICLGDVVLRCCCQ